VTDPEQRGVQPGCWIFAVASLGTGFKGADAANQGQCWDHFILNRYDLSNRSVNFLHYFDSITNRRVEGQPSLVTTRLSCLAEKYFWSGYLAHDFQPLAKLTTKLFIAFLVR